jgi:TolB-like protein
VWVAVPYSGTRRAATSQGLPTHAHAGPHLAVLHDAPGASRRDSSYRPRVGTSSRHTVVAVAMHSPLPAAVAILPNMSRLLHEAKERRIWRTLVAYPAGAFVVLEAVAFFVQNYGLPARSLTLVLIAIVVMFPAAVLWNWMHGPAGRQTFRRGELVTYGVLAAASLTIGGWYWATAAEPAVAPSVAPDASGQTAIAVLPFTTNGDTAGLGFLGDGIAENLIDWLSNQDGVRVISRSSSFALRELVDQPREIGRQLGVGRALLGRLEQSGDEVVVSVELVDTWDSGRLWGQRFAKPGSDLHELELEIANAIAQGLALGHPVGGPVAPSRAQNPEAYRLYLQGRYLTHGGSEVDIDEGLEILRRATSVDPSFTLAYAAIADALTQKALFAVAPSDALIGEARTAANSAIALDPSLSEAWTALASVRFFFDWDWEGAAEAFEKAIALGPANATAFQRYADLLWSQWRMSEARRIAAEALEMDPIDSNVMHAVGITALWDGDYQAAARAFGSWKRLHPTRLWSYLKEGLSLAFAGDCARGLELADESERLSEGWGSALYQSWLAWVYDLCDRPELLARAGRRLRKAEEENRIEDPLAMVFLLAAEGDVEGTIKWLEKSVDERSGSAPLLLSFWSEPARRIVPAAVLSDPRVLDLVRRMDLPPPADVDR